MPAWFTSASRKSWISSTSKLPIFACLMLHVVDEERPPREVDDRLHQRLVERHRRLAEAADAGLVAERLAQRLAEHEPDVLDRVVVVDLEIAAWPARSGRRARAG